MKSLCQAKFTLIQEGVLRRAHTQREEEHLAFILMQGMTVFFPLTGGLVQLASLKKIGTQEIKEEGKVSLF